MIKKVLWALFGNDEDGFYGDTSWNPEQKKSLWIAVQWWVRNPFHNLTFHVICPKSPFTREGSFPKDVFNPCGSGWNRCVITSATGKKFPFISYIGWCKFYIGWRERGNFGIKLTLNRKN